MNIVEHMNGLLAGWRVRAIDAWATLRQRPATKAASAPVRRAAPSDPTKVLFPDEEDAADGGGRGLALSVMLEESARAMVRRTDELREQKRALMARMGDRAEAVITLNAQILRLAIGAVWFAAAAWLYFSGMGGEAALPAGMPAADAFVLSKTFLTVAAAGFSVAAGVIALVFIIGNASNRRIRSEADQLGRAIADTSREFDTALTGFRAAMDRRGDPADAVIDLSRAHLTALEACAYFRDISFLTGEGDQAARRFRGFLSGRKANPPPVPVFLLGAIFGGIIGAGYIFAKFVPKPELIEPIEPLAIAQYPEALILLLAGGVLYAFIGLIVSLIAGPIAAGTLAKARIEALDALRGGFTAREAPRPADVVRRIEDAVDVFRARVGGRRDDARRDHGGANQATASNASYSAEDSEVPAWRRRDSSVKFVDAGFTTAPKEWRTDAFAKKFAAQEDGKPGSKRGRLSFKKSPGD